MTLYATDGKCHNSQVGRLNQECGTPAEWIGATASGWRCGFCSWCKEHGDERFDIVKWERVGAAPAAAAGTREAALAAALHAFLRAPSIGSRGPGSVTIEVQSFNLKDASAAYAMEPDPVREAAAAMLAALQRLLAAPDLNLDDLEPETVAAIADGRAAVLAATGDNRACNRNA